MSDKKKPSIAILVSMIISVLFITIGLSFAYFTAQISGTETSTTINLAGGVMEIAYESGDVINATGVIPSNEPFDTKNFTLTGNNTTDQDMHYHIVLVVEENTFTEGALTYNLISENPDENGEVALSTEGSIPTGANDIILGSAYFTGPFTGDKVHSYSLELYFPETFKKQNENQGKTFRGYINIKEGRWVNPENLLGNKILAQYGGADNIQEAPEDTFESVSGDTDNLMYKMEDDYGTSYYFRGAKAHLSNNLIFAEHQWKIVRINGDGSIRIIYNGTCPNDECSINSTGTQTQITNTAFNSTANDNKFVGYMYGTYSTNYETAHANDEDSTIKTVLDSWYEENIKGTRYEGYLSDTLFCADRTKHSGDGYGGVETYYASYNRLQTNKTPTLKCSRKEDRFTVVDTEKGNGALTYPIALLTADETSLAGLLQGTINTSNYLHTGEYQWLLSPARFSGSAYPWNVGDNGHLINNSYAARSRAARGVLNLNSNIEISGTGTSIDPYKVI